MPEVLVRPGMPPKVWGRGGWLTGAGDTDWTLLPDDDVLDAARAVGHDRGRSVGDRLVQEISAACGVQLPGRRSGGQALRGIEEHLLQGAGQVAAPDEDRRCGQRMVL
jgi:hypothetical protein